MKKNQIEREYLKFISHLKILGMRAAHEKNLQAEKEYQNLAQKLEVIKEKRHLDMIGEPQEATRIYEEIGEKIISEYDGSDKSVKNMLQNLKQMESLKQQEERIVSKKEKEQEER